MTQLSAAPEAALYGSNPAGAAGTVAAGTTTDNSDQSATTSATTSGDHEADTAGSDSDSDAAQVSEIFDRCDTNHDGEISRQEV